MAWDAEGRLVTLAAPDGSSESSCYDGEGNCIRHTDQLGGVTALGYGPFDLLAARATPDGAIGSHLRSELARIGSEIRHELRNAAPDSTAYWTAP